MSQPRRSPGPAHVSPLHRRLRALSTCLALASALATPAPAAEDGRVEVGSEDLVAIGRLLYREGRLASGEPLSGVVVGDVPVGGREAACITCHQRSGLGASEGGTGALPTTGALLFQPRAEGHRPRPAYQPETLAQVIRTGIDSGGRPLSPLMPRYRLGDRDMAGLIAYLETLSREISPGVTDTTVRFATIVSEDVDASSRRAMLDVLETFVREKNGRTRGEEERWQNSPFYREFRDKAYRRWVLDSWSLTGPPESWGGQLEAHYRGQPVFAVLSGIAQGSWAPVHAFCESHEMPCLLPNTDLPAGMGSSDFYTMYFSQGLTLEARVVAQDLLRRPPDGPAHRVLQVYRPDDSRGAAAARGLTGAGADSGGRLTVLDWALAAGEPCAGAALLQRTHEAAASVVVLWLPGAEVEALAPVLSEGSGRRIVYLSSTLLGADLAAVPGVLRPVARIVHPYALPAELEERRRRVEGWLRSRKIEAPGAMRIQAQTYFACSAAAAGLMHIRRFLYRDYLLDSIDHDDGLARFSVFYPRLSVGPRQRYLSKGSYVVELTPDPAKTLVARADWITP